MATITTLLGDCRGILETLPPASVNCVVTSPPYWGLRDYGIESQIGLEATPQEFVATMVEIFEQIKRILRHDGTLWLNLGDTYSQGSMTPHGGQRKNRDQTAMSGIIRNTMKPKNLLGIPWRVALALQDAGWILRSDIIWAKPNPMPESVTDRPTKSYEHLFLFAKSEKYYYDADVIKEPAERGYMGSKFTTGKSAEARSGLAPIGQGPRNEQSEYRNKRDVWTVATQRYPDAHYATFPPKLIEPCILAGCPVGGTVLDPFGGSGTTGRVAIEHGRNAILIELNPEYLKQIDKRTDGVQTKMAV